ncbi:MAG: hypothetical protein CVV37_04825 [Nitrospira bacterium HGW-Nitrospira-1]|nr:MAG: hypothetical protein CVV37_04825 [Nitrospira bacterium HGW-Nitrospira-1]
MNIQDSTSQKADFFVFPTGTIARKLSLKLPCSVALVRVVHSGRVHPRRILVPVKARIDHVKERACFTTHMARAFGSKVFVFHAPKPLEKFFRGEIHLTPEIREVAGASLTIRFFRQFTHFLAVLLWVGAGLAFLSDYLHPGEGMAPLGQQDILDLSDFIAYMACPRPLRLPALFC